MIVRAHRQPRSALNLMRMNTAPPDNDNPARLAQDRWPFIRDVLVLQVKLVLSNLQNFVMVPVTLIVALFDLCSRPRQRHGENFYKVLELSREIDEGINAYGAIGGYHATGPSNPPPAGDAGEARAPGVDGVIRRVEDVIVREYRKGGTAASLKAAVDRVLDDLQRESKKKS